jgi:hypothetical protein
MTSPPILYCLLVVSFLSEFLYDWRYTANQFVLAPSTLRLMARTFFLNWTSAVIVLLQHRLWREDGSVIYDCCCSSPAHSFSGPSPVELATIFYCLRLDTSLFVASYDSQGYGGGIRPRHQFLVSGWSTLCNLGAARKGITSFHSYFLALYQFVSAETWLLSRCLAADDS